MRCRRIKPGWNIGAKCLECLECQVRRLLVCFTSALSSNRRWTLWDGTFIIPADGFVPSEIGDLPLLTRTGFQAGGGKDNRRKRICVKCKKNSLKMVGNTKQNLIFDWSNLSPYFTSLDTLLGRGPFSINQLKNAKSKTETSEPNSLEPACTRFKGKYARIRLP